MIRQAYRDAATLFVETVQCLGAENWQQPGLGVWTVRDLVGHTSRALLTVETYLAQPATGRELQQPADYFLQARAALADPAAVAARGREAGVALGTDAASTIGDIAARVLLHVAAAADDVLVRTPVGGMRLIDYLPTRIFELTVHTLDIAAACGLDVTVPPTASAVALQLLVDLGQHDNKATSLLLAATGRGPLPDGFSVL